MVCGWDYIKSLFEFTLSPQALDVGDNYLKELEIRSHWEMIAAVFQALGVVFFAFISGIAGTLFLLMATLAMLRLRMRAKNVDGFLARIAEREKQAAEAERQKHQDEKHQGRDSLHPPPPLSGSLVPAPVDSSV